MSRSPPLCSTNESGRENTFLNGDKKQMLETDGWHWPWSVWDTAHHWLSFVLKDLNPGLRDLNSIQEIQARRTRNLGGVLWRLQWEAMSLHLLSLVVCWLMGVGSEGGENSLVRSLGNHSPLTLLLLTWRSEMFSDLKVKSFPLLELKWLGKGKRVCAISPGQDKGDM